tara:strand:- start:543 stop:1376 length:834 start_codon:yes stop_codon:yes gene_type:complete
MSNVFKDIQKGAGNVQKSLLGPDYNYAKAIKPPGEIGMSSRGTMSALAWNIVGINDYVNVLVSGDSKAQRNGGSQPLGQRFYLKTAGKCCSNPVLDDEGNQKECKKKQDRYMFINNVPTGNVPFISDATGRNFPTLRGLVPGTMENIGKINPLEMISGFMQGAYPKCRKLNIKSNSSTGPKSGVYVADSDIANLNGCLWNSNGKPRSIWSRDTSGKNPVSGEVTGGCAEGFQMMNKKLSSKNYSEFKEKKNLLNNLYNLGFSTFLIYLMYHLIVKHN